ncbi:MAG: hypothetical protein AB1813_15930 [Verrucomicrobiota bacterium]
MQLIRRGELLAVWDKNPDTKPVLIEDTASWKGITFTREKPKSEAEPDWITLSSGDKSVELEVEQFKHCKWLIPAKHTFRLFPNPQRTVLDMESPRSNKGSTLLRLPDDATAEIRAGSTARLDLLNDLSYYVSGRGNVEGKNNEGRVLQLSALEFPLTGGPLAEITYANGKVRKERLVPTTHVFVSGSLDTQVHLHLAGQHAAELLKLVPGQRERVSFSNGSAAEFHLDKDSGFLTWNVERGYFLFKVAGCDCCWQALTLTDQIAELQWDEASELLEIKNESPEKIFAPNRHILVHRAPEVNISVDVNADFQYGGLPDCIGFGVAALWGEVMIANTERRQVFPVERDRPMFEGRLPLVWENSSLGQPQQEASLEWNGHNTAQLSATGTKLGVKSSQTGEFKVQESVLQVGYPIAGELALHARKGHFRIQLTELLPTASLFIPEGNEVHLRVDRRFGVLIIETKETNEGQVQLFTGGAFAPLLKAKSKLTIVLLREVSGSGEELSRGPTGDATAASLIRFNRTGETIFLENTRNPTLRAELKTTIVFEGVEFTLQPKRSSVLIRPIERHLEFEVSGFSDTRWSVRTNSTLLLTLDFERRILDLKTGETNSDPVRGYFSDDGKVEIHAGSTARFDLFKDESYYVSGRGKVSGTTAEGQPIQLTANGLPLSGGALVERMDAQGKSKRERMKPLILMSVGGSIEDELDITFDQSKELKRVILRNGSREKIDLPNGSIVHLSFDGNLKVLEWSVEKGFLQIVVPGFDCWKGFALTDQIAGQTWSLGSRLMEIRNRSADTIVPPNREILVYLASRIHAIVDLKAVFQYAPIHNCTTFASAASGGDVRIYNSDLKETTVIENSNQLFKSGIAYRGETTTPKSKIALTWKGDDAAKLATEEKLVGLPETRRELIEDSTSQAVLEADHSEKGFIILRAVKGDHLIRLNDLLPDAMLELPQGNEITLQVDRGRGVFAMKASSGNATPIRILTDTGFSSFLGSSSSMTVVLGRTSTDSNLVFFEGAGASSDQQEAFVPVTGTTPFGTGFGTQTPNEPIDVSRIQQPPTSVVR